MPVPKSSVLLAALSAIFAAAPALAATAVATSDYRDFSNPYLATWEIGQNMPGNTFTVGPVSMTHDLSLINGIFAFSFTTGTPSDPATPSGWGTWFGGEVITLNLDRPVAAFGATFSSTRSSFGSILRAYDGPNGTGQLLGQIESIVVPAPWSASKQPIDFVGVIADQASIQSVVLSGHGTEQVFVHAIAVSIPEPSAALLVTTLLPLVLVRTKRPRD